MWSPRRVAMLLVCVALVLGALALWRRGGRTRPRPNPTAATEPIRAVASGDLRDRPDAAIAGRVRDGAGAPIAGASVCVTAEGPRLDEAMRRAERCTPTGADGRYRLDGLVGATYHVHGAAPGLAPVRWRGPDGDAGLALAPGEVRDGIELVLSTAAVLVTGRVVDVGGGAIAGAAVAGAALAPPGRRRREALALTGGFTITDDDGRFTLAAAPGELAVRARADGYADGVLDAVAPTSGLVILLTPASAIEGVVVDPGDRPVEGALVDLAGQGADGPRARTSRDGRFRLAPVPPGRYRPRALTAAGLGLGAHDVVLGLGQTVDDVRLVVQPTGSVVGEVVVAGPPDTPCPGAEVTLEGPLGAIERRAFADGAGRVELLGVPPAVYGVRVECRSARAVEHPKLVVAGAAPVAARWTLAPGAAVRGRVTAPDGRPLGGATVSVKPRLAASAITMTDNDGRYLVRGLGPHPTRVSAVAPGFAGSSPQEVVVPEVGEVVVDVTLAAGGAVRGTVVDADGQARANHVVDAVHEAGAQVQTRTVADGSFGLAALAAGTWTITAEDGIDEFYGGTGPSARARATATVEVGATATVALVVDRGRGQITGRVVDADGAPVGDAWVTAAAGSGLTGGLLGTSENRAKAGFGERPVLTTLEGRFAITGLAPGRYDLYVQRPGGGAAALEGVELGAELAIVLDQPGSIVGTVTPQPIGPAPPWFTVTRTVIGGESSETETFFATDGRFRLPGLPAGTYRLSVDTPSQVGTATVDVADGRVATVTIPLLATPGARGRVVELGTGAPIAGHVVSVSPSDGLPGAHVTSGPTGPDGRFHVPRVPRGLVEFFVYGTAGTPYRNASAFVDVVGEREVEVGDIEVPRARVPRGQRPGRLGVTWEPTLEDDPRQARLAAVAVEPSSPAAAAGVRVDDRLVAVDGVPVTGRISVAWSLVLIPPGTAVRLTLARGVEVTVTAVE